MLWCNEQIKVVTAEHDQTVTTIATGRHSLSPNPCHFAVVSQMCINIGIIDISVKNALIGPLILTFDLSTRNYNISTTSQGHSL